MKQIGIGLSFIFLAGILTVPLGYSNAEIENQTNSTMYENSTISQNNIGQQVSDFVHQATIQFKQQKNETLNAIKDCREKIKSATPDMRSQIYDECHKNIQAIKEKYKDTRQQFQELFKRFKEDIKTLRHEANDISSNNDKDRAIKHINDDISEKGLGGLENALTHMKGMGLEHGKKGIENAMDQVNKTRGMEDMSSSSNSSFSQIPHSSASNGTHEDNEKGLQGKGKND